MTQEITFRAVVEILGKPPKHVEETLKGYILHLTKDERYVLVQKDLAEVKKQDDQELWSSFAELEVKTELVENILSFCLEYMPSAIEIIQPEQLQLTDVQISLFLNDLQARLHQVDLVAKQTKLENDHLKKNSQILLKNYILVLLSKGDLTSAQLSKLTGVSQDKLEDFLDQLIDEGRIDLNGDKYSNTEKAYQV